MNYKEYFKKLIEVATNRSDEFPQNKIFNHSRNNCYTNHFIYEGFVYSFVISSSKSRIFGKSFEGVIVEFLIDDESNGDSYFNQLKQFKMNIEESFDNTIIYWRAKQEGDNSNRYRIYAKMKADIKDTKNWDIYIKWQIDTMIKFLEVLPKYTAQLRKRVNNIIYPDEIIENNDVDLLEGVKKRVIVNSYERNSEAREKCIKHYGYSCSVCGFDFEKEYGEIGKQFIHVHHLIPLSEIREEYKVDSIKDLRPVCPNCHAMLHRKNPPYTIDDLKSIIKK